MGRDRKNENRGTGHFAKLHRGLMQEPAWRALSPLAHALYPWLLLEWRGPNANNNGDIKLSVRQAAENLGVARNTPGKAFHELQAKGFIVMTKPGLLGNTGNAKSPSFEITELALPTSNTGRRLYRDWEPGSDFPVKTPSSNNPTGRNGKGFSRHQIRDKDVINIETFSKRTSSK